MTYIDIEIDTKKIMSDLKMMVIIYRNSEISRRQKK